MGLDEFVRRVSARIPIEHPNRAEHSGTVFFRVRGEAVARRVCRAAMGYEHVSRPTAHVQVFLEDGELVYLVGISPCSMKDFVECLELT